MKAVKRILVVEDQASVRKALAGWFADEYEVAHFESAQDFLQSLDAFDFEDGVPTAMLLDFQMPGMTGVALQAALRQLNVEFPIVFMSGNAEKEDVIEAWRGGAVDFILKPFSGPQISAVVSALFEKMEASPVSMRVQSTKQDRVDLLITPREADVLLLLGEGYRQGEAAEILGIGLRTVKMYRGYLKDKLGLNTLVQLSRFYDQNRDEIQKRASGVSGRERPLLP